jgi:transposase-like protein
MSEKQKMSTRRRRTRAEVQELVAEFMTSGMRRTEFCRRWGLSFGTLDRQLKKQHWKRKGRRASSAGRLLPVELVARKSPRQ